MNSKKSKGNKATEHQSSKAPITDNKKIQNSKPSISFRAFWLWIVKVLPRIRKFIWKAMVAFFLLAVIFSMVALPLLVVFG